MGSELRDITVNKVLVPSAGENVEECQLAEWCVEDGSKVEYGDLVARLETDTVSTEINAEYTGIITLLSEEKQTIGVADTIAEIRSNVEDLKETERGKLAASLTKPEQSKASGSKALAKLGILVALSFVVVKYGVPLMNQISEKSTEVFAKGDNDKSTTPDESTPEPAELTEPAVTSPSSDVRITEGFATWEPAVREQLEYWIGEDVNYKLLSIDVNDVKDTMEIRYRTKDNEGFSVREKIVLKKDGFGERFIFIYGGKEFLVRPPE